MSWPDLGPTAEIEPDLAEWDYGDYEGQLSADIRKERPGWNGLSRRLSWWRNARASRPTARIGSSPGFVRCTAMSRSSRTDNSLRARRAMDRTADYRSAAFLARPGIAQRTGYNPDHPEVAVIARGTPVPRHCRVADKPAGEIADRANSAWIAYFSSCSRIDSNSLCRSGVVFG